MSTDVEDLLREGIEQFTREMKAPAGLIDRAMRRRRLLARRSVAGAAAALAAGAVAVVAVVVPGTGHDAAVRPVVLAADVVQRVSSALSAAEPGDIAQLTVTRRVAVPGGETVMTSAQEWSYGDQWRSMTYSPAGHLSYDEGYRSAVFTLVSYVTKTWVRERGLGRPAPIRFLTRAAPAPRHGVVPLAGPRLAPVAIRRGCEPVIGTLPSLFEPGLPGIGLSPVTLPGVGFSASVLPTARALRSAIACGALTIAGRQRVDGIDAIKLTSRRNSPISETIWASPTTYLPVRVVVRSDLIGVVRQTADITWLQPTAQNLAKLTVHIPAGFRRARLLTVALPVAAQIQGVPISQLRLFRPRWARRHSS